MSALILHDRHHGSQARILPGLGFNCFSLQVPVNGEVVEALDAEAGFEKGDQRGSRSGIPWLFPFPNRIERGRYNWRGKDYQLPVSDAYGNAIHGFVMDRPWRVVAADAQTAVAEFQLSIDAPDRQLLWPSDFLIEVRYTLRQACLRADIRIVNAGDQALPWGLGTHPYFRAPLGSKSKAGQCLVQVPAASNWELNDCLPTGQQRPVEPARDLRHGAALEGLKLDDVLTGIEITGGTVVTSLLDPAAGVAVTQVTDRIFRECVVFTPPGRPCVCLEPYTCVTNAINLEQQGIDAGWQVLSVGGEVRTWIEIHVGPILV